MTDKLSALHFSGAPSPSTVKACREWQTKFKNMFDGDTAELSERLAAIDEAQKLYVESKIEDAKHFRGH